MKLYEFYISQKRVGREVSDGLRHLTVIEEAHRLLKNVPISTDFESANIKGKAVETFCNILSEIRGYGEGFIVCEQIPTKLAPDAIKNTNLKITHRIVAEDERDVLGGSMNLKDEQKRFISSLDKGLVAVYGEGMDNSFLVKVENFKEYLRSYPDDVEIAKHMEKVKKSSFLGRISDCCLCRHLNRTSSCSAQA